MLLPPGAPKRVTRERRYLSSSQGSSRSRGVSDPQPPPRLQNRSLRGLPRWRASRAWIPGDGSRGDPLSQLGQLNGVPTPRIGATPVRLGRGPAPHRPFESREFGEEGGWRIGFQRAGEVGTGVARGNRSTPGACGLRRNSLTGNSRAVDAGGIRLSRDMEAVPSPRGAHAHSGLHKAAAFASSPCGAASSLPGSVSAGAFLLLSSRRRTPGMTMASPARPVPPSPRVSRR